MVLFDPDEAFGDDYDHFTAGYLTDERANEDTAEIVGLLGLEGPAHLLDAPCGDGRIAWRLAAAGHRVVGVDRRRAALGRALEAAAAAGADASFVQGDLRALPVSDRFDAAVCWFTSFGYFDDAGNRAVLAGLRGVLRAGGRLLVESLHHDGVVRHLSGPSDAEVTEVGDDLQIDRHRFDPDRGVLVTERTVVRGGDVRRRRHAVRLPTVPEWRRWLADAGFADAAFADRGGLPLTVDSWRLVVVATA